VSEKEKASQTTSRRVLRKAKGRREGRGSKLQEEGKRITESELWVKDCEGKEN